MENKNKFALETVNYLRLYEENKNLEKTIEVINELYPVISK